MPAVRFLLHRAVPLGRQTQLWRVDVVPTNNPKSRPDKPVVRNVAVLTGVFDPITLGHLDLIERGLGIFRRLIVGVGSNPEKSSVFSLDERMALVRECVAGFPRVTVKAFEGLAVEFVRQQGAGVIVRGVRSVGDLDYELTMARTNRTLEPTVETVFLPARESLAHISSSLIRQIARVASREELAKFVPAPVIEPLLMKLRKNMPR